MARERYVEQVQLLVDLLPAVASEPDFALKGGTAINLFYRDLPRLSVDIDLTFLPVRDRAQSLMDINEAIDRIATAGSADGRIRTSRIDGGGGGATRPAKAGTLSRSHRHETTPTATLSIREGNPGPTGQVAPAPRAQLELGSGRRRPPPSLGVGELEPLEPGLQLSFELFEIERYGATLDSKCRGALESIEPSGDDPARGGRGAASVPEVETGSHLNQALKQIPRLRIVRAPDLLPRLVGLEETSLVEECSPTLEQLELLCFVDRWMEFVVAAHGSLLAVPG